MAATATRYGHLTLTEFMGEAPEWEDVAATTKAAASLAREEWETDAENRAEYVNAILKQIAGGCEAIVKQIANVAKAFR